ncbi:hypothetical protein LV779_25930 [Streptomyces thinghirensis]|nr:hypothetical protein [Streptomyces thinghirensis]
MTERKPRKGRGPQPGGRSRGRRHPLRPLRAPGRRDHGGRRGGGRCRQGDALPDLRRPDRTDQGAVRGTAGADRGGRHDGSATAGPRHSPPQRVPAVLDALLCFKLDNRRLALVLEGAGGDSSLRGGALRALAHPPAHHAGAGSRPRRRRLRRPRAARRRTGRPGRAPGRPGGRAAREDAGPTGGLHRPGTGRRRPAGA